MDFDPLAVRRYAQALTGDGHGGGPACEGGVVLMDDVVKNDLDVWASASHGPVKLFENCGALGRIFGPAYSPHDRRFGEHLVDRFGPSLIPDFVEPAAHQL